MLNTEILKLEGIILWTTVGSLKQVEKNKIYNYRSTV